MKSVRRHRLRQRGSSEPGEVRASTTVIPVGGGVAGAWVHGSAAHGRAGREACVPSTPGPKSSGKNRPKNARSWVP